ncbi:MAG: hypothetical protein K0Q64_743, partial [Nitrobacter vulgaris]|nr:hypothetical protein [Nitrobacter vulgaris]
CWCFPAPLKGYDEPEILRSQLSRFGPISADAGQMWGLNVEIANHGLPRPHPVPWKGHAERPPRSIAFEIESEDQANRLDFDRIDGEFFLDLRAAIQDSAAWSAAANHHHLPLR